MKTCCFLGHRKIVETKELKEKLKNTVEALITERGVKRFLFGSRSRFDELCHAVVTELQEKYTDIQRVAYPCRSEYACKKGEKERLERRMEEILKIKKNFQEYEQIIRSDRVLFAGRASYVERNREMIDGSDYIVFYYDKDYRPPNVALDGYPPKSGTGIAYQYALRASKKGKKTIINMFSWGQHS